MNFRVRIFFIVFLSLFFSRAFSQATDKSEHPLLDKYYPQPKKDTPKTVLNAPVNPPETITTAAVPAKPVVNTPPAAVVRPITPPVVKPIVKSSPSVPQLPAATSSPVQAPPPPPTVTPEITTPISTSGTVIKNAPSITDTTSVIKPSASGARPLAKVQEVVQPHSPAPPIYMDTRLGSSTPQYDTYEKNNYGAGSVTTSPK